MKLNIEEALRYLGVGKPIPEKLRRQAVQMAERLTAALRPKYLYRVFPLCHEADRISLPGTQLVLTGETARRMLAQCDAAILLACTLGAEFDALLRTEQARDMAQAVLLDACGSAWVEAGCDAAEEELAARIPDRYRTDRFSPGYGDLPLALQPAFCAALDTGRRLGLYVTESLLLNPAKSVTAIIGLSGQPQMAHIRGCAYCAMRQTCQLRKGGKRCAS
ncbi:MAG: methionine synthase [Oscillospiraceae bacterium]|nr:methionine synthase [Oscillospiraceae bacterium]